MGLLDSVIGALGQPSGGGGAGQGELLRAVLAMLAQGQGGGLADLVGRLQRGGLGDAVGSWVGTGQNMPVSPDALGGALGDDLLAGLAQRSGIDAGALLGPLAQLLPQVVDQLTPHGRLPEGGADAMPDLGDLLARLGGR
ncbi:MAG: DUF937 domain-containing protein [Piscinibacter sp.]|nr:DUF937 domain-containing protein [Piscinibacter sp.]